MIIILSTFRQVVAAGKDPSEDKVEKIELECVRQLTAFVTSLDKENSNDSM